MFRERPLTWLFVVATVAVDMIIGAIERTPGLTESLKVGFVLSQLAALAMWSVRGRMHRLARMSCLVLATGMLTYLIDIDGSEKSIWTAFNSMYVFWIVVVTSVSDALSYRLRKGTVSRVVENRWQVPLIEFFGWTIFVAIISFAARHMDFRFLDQSGTGLVVSLLAVPTCIAVFVRQDLRDLWTWRAIVLLSICVTAGFYTAKEQPAGEYAILMQSAYLGLWLAVLAMDELQSKVRRVREGLIETREQNDAPQLFHPQD